MLASAGMDEYPELRGDGITLRPPLERDVEARLQGGEDEALLRGFGADPANAAPMTRARAEAWYRRSTTTYPGWVIADRADTAIGMAWLGARPYGTRAARFSIGIWRPDLRGKGIGRHATKLVLAHAFGARALHRVELTVLASNVAAVRCYEAAGFRHEGRSRQVLFLDGAWLDDVHMGILEHDFRGA